jgi:hypothetical protein
LYLLFFFPYPCWQLPFIPSISSLNLLVAQIPAFRKEYHQHLHDKRLKHLHQTPDSQPISANFHPNPGQIQCFQVWEVLQNGAGARVMPFWAPYCAASLQILLSLGKTGMKAGVKKQQVWGYYVM